MAKAIGCVAWLEFESSPNTLLLLQVPEIALDYWKLGEDATMRDLLLSIRADEACHSHVNHTFSQMASDDKNPFNTGTHTVPTA